MLALLLSLHALAGPGPVDPVRYKLVNKSSVDLGMGGMGAIELTMSAFVSITLSDSAGGRIAHVVIDSSTFDAGQMAAMMQGQMGDDPKGVSLHAYFVNGKAKSIVPSAQNVQAMQLVSAVQLLLAGTRTSKAGDSWVDSTVADTAVSAMTTRASLVTQWKASPAGAGAVQLDGAVTGTTTFGNGQMQMDMQTTGTSHITTRPGALPSVATSSTTGSGNMNLGGQSMTMKVGTEVSATLIP